VSRKQPTTPQDYIKNYATAHEAAQLLSISHNRPIRVDYIKKLRNKVRNVKVGKYYLYHKGDLNNIHIRQIGSRSQDNDQLC
jgi:hypothetical protein